MSNKLLDLKDEIGMQLDPLRILEFHLDDLINESEFLNGGFKNELNTICTALYIGIKNIEKAIK